MTTTRVPVPTAFSRREVHEKKKRKKMIRAVKYEGIIVRANIRMYIIYV